MKKDVKTGVVGATLKSEPREVPDDAPAIWAESATLKSVGKATPRIDGAEKVTGRARYSFDVQRPGMLQGRILRSVHPHARVHRVDVSEAEKMPGVKAVVILPHLLGAASDEKEPKDQKLVPVVRYYGQPIAAVAAMTAAQAEAAVGKIKVDYQVLPHVIEPDDALKPGAPLVFEKPASMAGSAGGGGSGGAMPQQGNLRGPKKSGPRGKDAAEMKKAVTAALSTAKVKVSAKYRTQVQTHSAMETHGLVAEWSKTGDELTVWASTQGIFSVRDELAEYLEIPQSQIRVISDYVGGGFGAKFGAGNYGVLAAMLAKKAGAAVRVFLDRREEHLAVGNRPGSEQNVTLAAEADGRLSAMEVTGWGSGGAGAGAGFAGPVLSLYKCPAVYAEESDVFTHTGPLAAFRAPGHPQGAFALEQAMDELAEKLGLDPLKLRELNDPHAARAEERRRGAALFGWDKRQPAGKGPREGSLGHLRRGVGMAQGLWYHLVNLSSHAEVRIHRDGSVEVLTGVQDIGSGIRTPLAQVVAEELGLTPAQIKVSIGDTRLPPGPASGGSVTTNSITPAARDAAAKAKLALLKELQAVYQLDKVPELVDGKLVGEKAGKPLVTPGLGWKQACAKLRKDQVLGTAERQADYGGFEQSRGGSRGISFGQLGGVQFVEVEVDTLTGVTRVLRVVAAQDCGRPLNPLLVESQIHGGIIQGLSYALFEERRFDRGFGRPLNANLETYKIAGALDVPKIDVVLLEELRGRSSTDASGIGEPATVPTAAAVANAVYNALGVRIRELPITPARVLAALNPGRVKV
ncbi:MAG: xanthine dehydrogenase family protein molybdopterin-binding subunit [Polyangia bacterium]